MEGWIKLHRKILENPIVFKDSDYVAVWIYLLIMATHCEKPAVFKGEKITLQPGQLITGRQSISSKLRVTESKVQRILTAFESEQQIEQQTGNRNRLISILSWTEYQDSEQQNEQQMNNQRTTDEQQMNTNKNLRIKELKNERSKDIKPNRFSVYTSNPELESCLESFVEFRKKIRKPLTDRAVTLLLGELNKLASVDAEKIAILEQSILNGWQSVYALKNNQDSGTPSYRNNRERKPQMPVVTSNDPPTEITPEQRERMLERARRLAGERKEGSG